MISLFQEKNPKKPQQHIFLGILLLFRTTYLAIHTQQHQGSGAGGSVHLPHMNKGASEGICYVGLSVQLELQTGGSGVCILEVNEIMCFEQIKHFVILL